MFISKTNKIIGAGIVLLVERFIFNQGFTLSGILFTKKEFVEKSNLLFPDGKTVQENDFSNLTEGEGTSNRQKFFSSSSISSLSEYYWLNVTENNVNELYAILERIFLSLPSLNISSEFNLQTNTGRTAFINLYCSFIKSIDTPEQIQNQDISALEAVWIAAAVLAYNEFHRTRTEIITQYVFRQKTIYHLAKVFNSENTTETLATNTRVGCTHGANQQNYSYLMPLADRRRVSYSGDGGFTRPENLHLDFYVNTINGSISVRDLIDFIETDYTGIIGNGVSEAIESQSIESEDINDISETNEYLKKNFLSEVYFNESDYDKLLTLLRTKQNVILSGVPGVGKSFTAKRLAYSYIGRIEPQRIATVQFHQSYSYEDFVEGFRPTEDGYSLTPGIFIDFCKKASNDSENEYFFIIDEINRGNISKIFGELFMLIEPDKREKENIILPYSRQLFTIPENIFIIGLMNTADRSLAMLDYALRRRFAFFKMTPVFDTDGFKKYQSLLACTKFSRLIDCIKELNIEIAEDDSLGEGFCIGHSYFCNLTPDNVEENLDTIIEHEIIPLLEEYWFDNPSSIKKWSDRLIRVLQ